MSEISVTTANFGAEAIEATLRSLWGEAAKGASVHVRRRMINVIIVAADSNAAEVVAAVIDQVATTFSGRYIVVVLNPDQTALAKWEKCTAVCQVAVSNSAGMNYERILIPYTPGQSKELPYIVKSLLQQELPVVLWWRYIFNPKEWLFEEFSRMAERTLIDSVTLTNPAAGMGKILAMSQSRTIVRDINWTRITPWRLAIASFYDVPSYRPYLSRLSDLRIEYSHQLSRQNALNNSQVLLLFGWLATRLQWRLGGNLTEDIPNSRYRLQLTDQGRSLSSYFTVYPALGHLQAGIKSICLSAVENPSGTFVVSRCEDGKHITTRLTLEGLPAVEKVTCLEIGDEAELIANELLSPCAETLYLETLAFLNTHSAIWSKAQSIESEQ